MICPVNGCDQPAGTRCTMSGCPGFKNTRALSPSLRADTQAAGFDPFSPVACFSIPSHDAAHNAVTQ